MGFGIADSVVIAWPAFSTVAASVASITGSPSYTEIGSNKDKDQNQGCPHSHQHSQNGGQRELTDCG